MNLVLEIEGQLCRGGLAWDLLGMPNDHFLRQFGFQERGSLAPPRSEPLIDAVIGECRLDVLDDPERSHRVQLDTLALRVLFFVQAPPFRNGGDRPHPSKIAQESPRPHEAARRYRR